MKTLALVEFTENADGSVTVECDPAPRCERCRHSLVDQRIPAMFCALAENEGNQVMGAVTDLPLMLSHSGDYYGSSLQVTRNFGCVLYEAKDEPAEAGER